MMAVFFTGLFVSPGFFVARFSIFRGGNSNIFYFHPEPWGFMIHFDEHIFQRGWNHQLVFLRPRSLADFFPHVFFECLQVVVQASPSDEIKTFNSRAESPQIQNDNRRTTRGSQVKLKVFFFEGSPSNNVLILVVTGILGWGVTGKGTYQGTIGCTPNSVPMVFIVFSRDSWRL